MQWRREWENGGAALKEGTPPPAPPPCYNPLFTSPKGVALAGHPEKKWSRARPAKPPQHTKAGAPAQHAPKVDQNDNNLTPWKRWNQAHGKPKVKGH